MKILIVGCGYLGSALARHFVGQGHEVWGLKRDGGAIRESPLQDNPKFHFITADLLDPMTLKNLPQVDTIILCQAPKRNEDNYQGTYFEGTKNILNVIHKSPRIIFISSTGVYGIRDGSWVDETTDPRSQGYASRRGEENAQILLDTERLVLQSGLPAMIFRLGGIYGPGRHRLGLLKEGKIKPSFSNVYVNRIRLEDIATGVEILLERGKAGEIYLGVDDQPVTQNEFYSWLAEKLRLEGRGAINRAPTESASVFSGKRCSNKKIKALGIKFQFPTFREGYQGLLKKAL